MEVNLISGTMGRSWWKANRNDFTGMHSFPNWRVSKIIMSVKLSQSRHKFRDSVLPLVTQHSTCPQGVTEWFYFSISLNISLSFCGIKAIYRMLSRAITTTRSDQLQWNTFLKHSAFPACAKDYLSTWLASLSGMQRRGFTVLSKSIINWFTFQLKNPCVSPFQPGSEILKQFVMSVSLNEVEVVQQM